ncbi:MAG: DUF420 domain-containing protein [Saprospiraceae bacterium]|nr:DUF420 domain-containing protein [Saprospiraceae bacterium]
MANEPNIALARRLNIVAWVISALVLGLVVMMRRIKLETSVDFSMLPAVHAAINTITSLVLIMAFVQIRKKRVERHRRLMYVAIFLSLLFLLSYVTYHITTPETAYCKEGSIRMVYFTLLISHIVLAAIIFPFILFTFIRAYTRQYDRHRRMARWVFPIWLYVAVSGPIVYLMLRPCYG